MCLSVGLWGVVCGLRICVSQRVLRLSVNYVFVCTYLLTCHICLCFCEWLCMWVMFLYVCLSTCLTSVCLCGLCFLYFCIRRPVLLLSKYIHARIARSVAVLQERRILTCRRWLLVSRTAWNRRNNSAPKLLAGHEHQEGRAKVSWLAGIAGIIRSVSDERI